MWELEAFQQISFNRHHDRNNYIYFLDRQEQGEVNKKNSVVRSSAGSHWQEVDSNSSNSLQPWWAKRHNTVNLEADELHKLMATSVSTPIGHLRWTLEGEKIIYFSLCMVLGIKWKHKIDIFSTGGAWWLSHQNCLVYLISIAIRAICQCVPSPLSILFKAFFLSPQVNMNKAFSVKAITVKCKCMIYADIIRNNLAY